MAKIKHGKLLIQKKSNNVKKLNYNIFRSFKFIGHDVRIYSPCMSRHEGVNTSRGACLMH